MQVLAPAGALALLAVPAIVALYFLKVRRPEVSVATLLFWRRHVADRQADAPWQRLRLSALLVVQLLVAAALALALMRPGLARSTGVATTTVVLIDGSPTMRATDVRPSRFGAAVALARRMSKRLEPGHTMAVAVLGDHARLLARPTRDGAVLRRALERARPTSRPADLAEGISLANAILAGRPGGSALLISDGHFEPPPSTPRLSGSLAYRSVGNSGDNAGVEAVTRQPDGSVSIRVANLGRGRRNLDVEVRADGRLVDVLPLGVDGNASAETTWGGLRAGTRIVEARLRPTDALALDDAAWLVTPAPARRRALLVTPGNGFLQAALALRDDLDLTVSDPAQYRPGTYDLYVFDRFVPPGPLPAPALVIAPPPGAGPLPGGEPVVPGAVLPPNPRDVLVRYVTLRDVHVQAASRVTPLPGWRTVAAAANGPLLLVHDGQPRLAELTFDVHGSDLPLRPAFPVLVQNLVSYLLPGGFENQVLPLGEPIPLATRPGATSVDVTGPAGSRRRLRPPFPPALTDTSRPGVYTVRETGPGGSRTGRFVVQLPVPQHSRVEPGAGPAVEAEDHRGPRRLTESRVVETWPWWAAAALAGAALEWVLFLRG